MCSDEGRVVDWLLDDVRVDATAGLLPRSAAAGEGLRGRAHLAQTTIVPKWPGWSPMSRSISPYRDIAHALCRSRSFWDRRFRIETAYETILVLQLARLLGDES